MDKLQKVRAEIERLRQKVINGATSGQYSSETIREKNQLLVSLISFIDSIQEEPVSDDLESEIQRYNNSLNLDAEENYEWDDIASNVILAARHFAKWEKQKDESCSKDLGEYINELSKQFSEVSFAKLSRIAVRVAKWQIEQFEKNRLEHCDSITNEQAELEQKFLDQHLDKYQRMPTFLDAIEYGMRLKEKQMIEKAIEWVEYNNKNGGCEFDGWVENIKQAMKDET